MDEAEFESQIAEELETLHDIEGSLVVFISWSWNSFFFSLQNLSVANGHILRYIIPLCYCLDLMNPVVCRITRLGVLHIIQYPT